MSSVSVCVDGVPVAVVPFWMIKHAVKDAIAKYSGKKIIVEVL